VVTIMKMRNVLELRTAYFIKRTELKVI